MWFLLISLGLAAAPQEFPWQASVDLPADGVARISVPPNLRTALDPGDGRDFLLVNGQGDAVPFAVVRGSVEPNRVKAVAGSKRSTAAISWWPGTEQHTYMIEVRGRLVEALQIVLPETPSAATAKVEQQVDGAWKVVGLEEIWRVDGDSNKNITIPQELGTFRLALDYHGRASQTAPTIHGLRWSRPPIADERIDLEVDSWRIQEDGTARYDLQLPHRWPIKEVTLWPDEDLFDRQAAVEAPAVDHRPDGLTQDTWHSWRSIRRLDVGGARVDRTTLTVDSKFGDRMAVYISAEGQIPLSMKQVQVSFPGMELLVRDAGEGPHMLYAGAIAKRQPSDLQFAVAELARVADVNVEPGAKERNPQYRPPEERSGLVQPSSQIDVGDYQYSHALVGAGLVRVPLTEEVLAAARSDLGDVRIVDADNHQIPYLIRSRASQQSWGELTVERTENGKTSVLEVALPHDNVVVGSVTLHTKADLFSRRVTISEPRGGRLQTLRVFDWQGGTRPDLLTLDVMSRMGDTLVISIENGDNPPLPVDRVEATWPSWDVVTTLPEGGASLIYGNARQTAPDYDLTLLRDRVLERATAEVGLGARVAVKAAPLSFVDQGVMLLGVGVMCLGLLGLTVVLIFQVPADKKDEDEPSEDAPEDPPERDEAADAPSADEAPIEDEGAPST
jgi:hypothetical protein